MTLSCMLWITAAGKRFCADSFSETRKKERICTEEAEESEKR